MIGNIINLIASAGVTLWNVIANLAIILWNIVANLGIVGLFLLGIYCTCISVYNLILGLRGFGKAKRDYEIIPDKSRVCILVACHNEEDVIASTVENLREIDYDKSLYDVIVVNDNSTDGTEDELKRIGARYINTNEGLFAREGVGKPGGLQYALRYLGFENVRKNYDLVMILDADNHVSPNILKELNSQWIGTGKPTAIQSYLDSKNFDKALSFGYANAYVVSNRFFQLAKYRWGLPNALGGTGFVVSTDYLIDSGGFNYKSLTEDLEMEIEVVNKGGQVLWNHFARIYDEKPDDIKISIKQRTRWMQGHWYVAFTNLVPLIKGFIKERRWTYIDQIIYLFGGAKVVQLAIMIFSLSVSTAYMYLFEGALAGNDALMHMMEVLFSVSIVYFVSFIYQMLIIPIYAYKHDSRIKFNIFRVLISSFYYAVTFMYCQIAGLLKWRHQHTWVKTEHKVKKVK